MKKITTLILSFLALIIFNNAKSQHYLGVINSNYIGVMGADLQPASIVDSRFMVDVNLFSFSIDAYQNAKYFDADILPKRSWLYSLRKDTSWMEGDDLYDKAFHSIQDYNDPNAKPVGGYINFQFDIMNFMFHINRNIAVGFSAKIRFINNLDNIQPKMLKLAEEGLDFKQLWHMGINGSLFSENMLMWAEYGINYAQVVYDEGEHFFKVGGRVKFNQGIAAAYAYANDLKFNLDSESKAADLQGNMSFGYSKNIDRFFKDNSPEPTFSNFYNLTSKLGLGLDVGVVYEWRPNWKEYKYDMDGETNLWRRDRNKYKIRAGVSLLDLGGMRFTKADRSRNFSVDTKNLDLHIFDEVDGPEEFAHTIDSLIKNDPDWKEKEGVGEEFYMHTPTTLSFQFDWHIWDNFYLNAIAYMNVNSSKNAHNVRVASQYSITPSYDFRWAGIGVPVSYNKYSGFKVGLGLRLGPLTIGVPDLKTLFPGGKVRGGGIYAGLRVPILYGHPSDRDGDKVSDKMDLCIDVPGIWDFRGCPDSDGDGIQDAEDACPMTPGLPEFNGCPDTDKDGIPDKEDDCPQTAGLPEFNGCPDSDSDGIPDKKDDCPDKAGLAKYNGCPDTDKDGIPDYKDACPEVPGPEKFQGCPDTDGDGILDFLDKCPHQPGPKANNGCPWPDTDGDGILDKEDKCPNLAGPAANDGCPYTDTDGDGIRDADDKCPEVKGPIENEGCPEIDEETKAILQKAFDDLQFTTARAIIRPESYPSLIKLAEVLKEKPKWNLQLSGYTDNVGNDQSNLVLSKKRAESVRRFLSEQGISKDRVYVLYFGERDPVASNSTAEGRQQNRRVEMQIIFK